MRSDAATVAETIAATSVDDFVRIYEAARS